MSVFILHTHYKERLPNIFWQKSVALMPPDIQARLGRLLRWQDRQSLVLGRLLLCYALQKYGYSETCLYDLQYSLYRRPYLCGSEPLDFNLSHSGARVLCAVNPDGMIGIDIEKIQLQKDLAVFKGNMTDEQWQDICNYSQPNKRFYYYWSIKESCIKADGRGLHIPLENIYVDRKKTAS